MNDQVRTCDGLLAPYKHDAEITADVITAALRHVKIPTLTRYLTHEGVLEYVVTPREQGGGTYTQVRLPMGVTAAELLSIPSCGSP